MFLLFSLIGGVSAAKLINASTILENLWAKRKTAIEIVSSSFHPP